MVKFYILIRIEFETIFSLISTVSVENSTPNSTVMAWECAGQHVSSNPTMYQTIKVFFQHVIKKEGGTVLVHVHTDTETVGIAW